MRIEADRLLTSLGGVAARTDLLRVLTENQLDDEIRRGHLTRVFRRTYCRPWDADRVAVRERGALMSVGAPALLSHLTALRCRGLIDPPASVHVSIPSSRLSRPQPGLVVHRLASMPTAIRLDGLPTATVAEAVVTSWPMLAVRDRRAPAIDAVRQRLVTPIQLTRALASHSRIAGRRDLERLVHLLETGCESELEIWGCVGVFDVPGLRHGTRQRRIRVAGKTYRLDLAFDAERVAVEMDGDRWHSSRASRDRDRRRDAALATAGWLTLRFGYDRLHDDVDGCRHDTLATLAARGRCNSAG